MKNNTVIDTPVIIPASLKAAREDSRYLSVNVNGNKKLINTAETAFIIWNLPAVVTCPYRTTMCERDCYALKAERVYPSARKCRRRNFDDSRRDDFVSRMIYTLSVEISRNLKKGKKTIVRIHESGDFYNKKYFCAWLEIARAFLPFGDMVVFMAYTKSVVYAVGESIPANMVLRFSLWADTDPAQIELATALNLPVYTADTETAVNAAAASGACQKCECRDCANCGLCWDANNRRISCVIH